MSPLVFRVKNEWNPKGSCRSLLTATARKPFLALAPSGVSFGQRSTSYPEICCSTMAAPATVLRLCRRALQILQLRSTYDQINLRLRRWNPLPCAGYYVRRLPALVLPFPLFVVVKDNSDLCRSTTTSGADLVFFFYKPNLVSLLPFASVSRAFCLDHASDLLSSFVRIYYPLVCPTLLWFSDLLPDLNL